MTVGRVERTDVSHKIFRMFCVMFLVEKRWRVTQNTATGGGGAPHICHRRQRELYGGGIRRLRDLKTDRLPTRLAEAANLNLISKIF